MDLDLNYKNTIRLLNHPLTEIQFYQNVLLENKLGKAMSIKLNSPKKHSV